MDDDAVPSEGSRGRLLARLAPQGVGLRLGVTAVNASWPFPRAFAVYEGGIFVSSLGTSAWIPRDSISSLHRGPGNIRVKWELGGGTSSATVSSWFHIGRVEQALTSAGYHVLH